MHRPALLLLLVSAFPAATPAQTLPQPAAVHRVADSLAQAFLAAGGSPSVAIGVIRGADTIEMRAWGLADLEQNVPATSKSVYRIGSVTKQFTAAAVMQLVEQQQVKLDDSIATYLPDLPKAWHRVTVRQLLNHTSGIPSYTDIGARWIRRWGEEMPPDTLIALTANDTMWFAPGTSWRYDNTGYVVLGMLIEKVSGRSWGADMKERFFKPLGLTNTHNCLATPVVPGRARGYETDSGHWINTPYLAMSQPYSAGSLCSSVEDLARWNRALHTGKVVSSASYALMTTPEGAAAKAALRYGFGLAADSVMGVPIVTHGGGIPGFITANAWVPSAELSVTVLTNSGSARPDSLLHQLVRAALGMPLLQVQPVKIIALSPPERQRYVGVYALALSGGARNLTIAEQGDQLTAQLAGQGANPMLYYGNHTFGMSFDAALRLIFTVDADKAVKVTLIQNGGRFEGVRN